MPNINSTRVLLTLFFKEKRGFQYI